MVEVIVMTTSLDLVTADLQPRLASLLHVWIGVVGGRPNLTLAFLNKKFLQVFAADDFSGSS